MRSRIITLTTDFGLRDSYVAEMKAVILGIAPDVTIVDITHEVEKFNTRMAAYILACASPYFPRKAIHLAVVDPYVGTRRKPLLIETNHCYLIGPDNGTLALAAENQGVHRIYQITNEELMLPKVSQTFHGRDVFAPAAAYLARGLPPAQFGPEIHGITEPGFVTIARRKRALTGEIIHIDGFGNIITNIGRKNLNHLSDKTVVDVGLAAARMRIRFCKTYAEVGPQEPLALIDSHGFLEFSLNQGNAAQLMKVKVGDRVTIYDS